MVRNPSKVNPNPLNHTNRTQETRLVSDARLPLDQPELKIGEGRREIEKK
jgi:hypothetical protein